MNETEKEKQVKQKRRERRGRAEQSKQNLWCDGRRPFTLRLCPEWKEAPVRVWTCTYACVCVSLCSSCWGVGPLVAGLVLNAEQAASGRGKRLQGLLSDCSTGCTWGTALQSNTATSQQKASKAAGYMHVHQLLGKNKLHGWILSCCFMVSLMLITRYPIRGLLVSFDSSESDCTCYSSFKYWLLWKYMFVIYISKVNKKNYFC